MSRPFPAARAFLAALFIAGVAVAEELPLFHASFETVDEGISPAGGLSGGVHLSGARLGDGLSGKGLVLDGKDDAGLVVDPGRDASHDALTVEVWALMRQRPAGRALVVGKTGSERGKWLYLVGIETSGVPFAEIRIVGGAAARVVQLIGSKALETKRFYHLALAYSNGRRRVALCVDGVPVDEVWLERGTTIEAEAGRIWIGWGPTSFEKRDVGGLPGTVDELTLSARDLSPFAVECIEGARLDPPEWRRIVVQARLSYDRFLLRAEELLKGNVLDAPRFVEWRFADLERWMVNREAGQLEEALAHCERVLTSLEAHKDHAGSVAPHPSPQEMVSLLPENAVYGEGRRLSFLVRRVAQKRVEIEVRGVPGGTRAMTVVCAYERCRFLPVDRWRREGDGRTWSGRMRLPSTRGKWKLCLIGDVPVVSLAIGGEDVFETTPERARRGAPASVFDLEGVVTWGEQDVAVTLAEASGGDGAPFTAYVVNTASLAFARVEGPLYVARALVGGGRVTVLAIDGQGNADGAFVEVFGDLQPSLNGTVSCDAVALGFATQQKATLLNDCELVGMLDATRAICGRRLRIGATAFARGGQEDRGGVTPAEADALAKEAGVVIVSSPDGSRRNGPSADVKILDGRSLFRRVGRHSGELRAHGSAPPAFLSPDALRQTLGVAGGTSYVLDWSPVRATAQTGGMGLAHPETVVLEILLSSHAMSLKEVMFDVGDSSPRPWADDQGGVLWRYVDRAAIRAACTALRRMPKEGLSWSAGQTLALGGEDFGVLAVGPGGPRPASGLDFWSAGIRRAGDPGVIVASSRGEAESRVVVTSCHGLVTVRGIASEIHHCYGVNAFGVRRWDVPFLNLAGEGIVFVAAGDPAIAYYEMVAAD